MRKNACLLFLLLIHFSFRVQSQTTSTGAKGPDACTALLSFVTDLADNQFKKYIGPVYSQTTGQLKVTEYASLISFSSALRTTIVDTGMLQPYRMAKLLMIEETNNQKGLSPKMADMFNKMIPALKGCLEPNKFVYDPDTDRFKQHLLTGWFGFELPSNGSPFANMRSNNHLVVLAYVDQVANKEGGFTDSFYLVIKRG